MHYVGIALTLTSYPVFIVSIIFFTRSCFFVDYILWRITPKEGLAYVNTIQSIKGLIIIDRMNPVFAQADQVDSGWEHFGLLNNANAYSWWKNEQVMYGDIRPFLAVRVTSGQFEPGDYCLIFPYLLLIITSGAIPIWRFTCWLRRERRRGHCRVCGYDLRASLGRCPECGTEIETIPQRKPSP